jgi:hypothetical protein
MSITAERPHFCHFVMSVAIEKSPNAANCQKRSLPAVDMTHWGLRESDKKMSILSNCHLG